MATSAAPRRPTRSQRGVLGVLLVGVGALLAVACVVPAPPPPAPPVIAAAGDIACDPADTNITNGDQGIGSRCFEFPTSDLLVAGDYDAVLTLGDNQYNIGDAAAFSAVYDPTWGRVKAITHPAPGNHDYYYGSGGYYGYFGAAAGDPAEGWYSFDLGDWHLIALNSNCSAVGGCEAGSPQEQWLRADLAASSATCTLAYWHHPRFSSSTHGDNAAYDAFWRALDDYGADVVLNGHDHAYERFAPQTPDAVADPAGIRAFVVGTGGNSHYGLKTAHANSEVFDGTTFGILELTLLPTGYDWSFVPAAGGSFTDSGHTDCS